MVMETMKSQASDARVTRATNGPSVSVPTAMRVTAPLLAVLLAVAAVAGIALPRAYEDLPPVAEMFRGYDLIALVLVVPTLLISLALARRGSVRGQLLAVSMFVYAAYTYALYVFGAVFNDFFLLHVTVFSVSVFALIFAFAQLDVTGLSRSFRPRRSDRLVAILLALLGASLAAMWIAGSVRFVLTGEVPEEGSQLVLPTGMTHLAYVMDLSILVPSYALAAILLWRRVGWGYVLATLLLISGAVHQLSYMAALVFQANAGIEGATAFDAVEPFILTMYVVGVGLLVANARPSSGGSAATT